MEIYDRNGVRINLDEYEELISKPDYKMVDSNMIKGVWISTVWLGINHNYGEGAPVIFETLIFGGKHDGEMERYCTEAEALEGHQEAVQRVVTSESAAIRGEGE
jgi:hypothetical protein